MSVATKRERADLKVIGAGFGRTGTMSLKEALEILGFPCYHMKEVFARGHQRLWIDVHMGRQPQWDVIFEGFTATVDWPSTNHWLELHNLYPNSKIILTERDFDKWYKSARDTIYEARHIPFLMRLLKPELDMNNKMIWDGLFKGRFEDKEFVRKIYDDHIEHVKRVVPPSKLLVYSVTQGWGPLCKFLGVPVPDVLFPRVNDTEEFNTRIKQFRTAARKTAIVGATTVAVIGVIAAFALRHFKYI